MNATFGNVVEMLICIAGIRNGEIAVVQCTLLGSILSNLLLVMGCAFLVGGLKYQTQYFSQQGASTQCTLLQMTVFSIGLPTIYTNILVSDIEFGHMVAVSRWSSVYLLLTYAAYMYFQLGTHSALFESDGGEEEEEEVPDLRPGTAACLLALATVITTFATDFLIGSLEGTIQSFNISREFVGIIMLPIIGNAAEHYTAITVAQKNKMDLSLGVAAGSSCQMGLLVTPFTVIVGWFYGVEMSLDFHVFQLTVLMLSVFLVQSMLQDGKSNWMEGLMLIVTYLILALLFFFEGNSDATSLASLA